MAADPDFMTLLNLKMEPKVRLGDWHFKYSNFYLSLADAVNGRETSLREITSEDSIIVKPVTPSPVSSNAVELINPRTQETRQGRDKMLPLLKHDVQERETFLREHLSWFDCDQERLENEIARIASTEDHLLRIQRIEKWHSTSATVYYDELLSKMMKRGGFQRGDLLPPSREGLLRHLRLPSRLNPGQKFSDALTDAAMKLLEEQRLRSALDRLSGLPVRLPSIILSELNKIDAAEKSELLNSLGMTWLTPTSKIHLLHLNSSLAKEKEIFMKSARDISEDLLSDNEDNKRHFSIFKAALQWVYGEFHYWPEAKLWSSSIRLALIWTHANKLSNILINAKAPFDWTIELFRQGGPPELPEIFDRNPDLWNDVSHPRRVQHKTMLLTGIASALEECDERTVESLGLQEAAQKYAFTLTSKAMLPAIELLCNVSLAGNALDSYMGMDKSRLGILIGLDMAHEVSSDKLAEYAKGALEDLEKDPSQVELWGLLYAVLFDLPVAEPLISLTKSVLERLDLLAFKNRDLFSYGSVLFAVVSRISSLNDEALRVKFQDQLVRLAKISAVGNIEAQTAAADSESSIPDFKGILLESAVAASVVLGNPEESTKNFAQLAIRLITVWPDFGIWLRPAIFRFVMELPVKQSKNFWNLLLTTRAL